MRLRHPTRPGLREVRAVSESKPPDPEQLKIIDFLIWEMRQDPKLAFDVLFDPLLSSIKINWKQEDAEP